MILTSPHDCARPSDDTPTLDILFRRAAIRNPDAIALSDPPDRAGIDGRAPRDMTFIAVDEAVTALAAKLRALDLAQDSVVAYQLPNTVETVIMLLAILRAGLIAAPLPILWRHDDIVTALARSGAVALITTTRIGDTNHAEIAMQAAAAHFPIRHVCVFGDNVPDGLVALDPIFDSDPVLPPIVTRDGPAAAHVALVTFDSDPDGVKAVARSHAALIAARVSPPSDTILCPLALSSVAGIALAIMPWITGGTRLAIHQPFDARSFAVQCRALGDATLVVPGPVADMLAETRALEAEHGTKSFVALWRSPEQWRTAPGWASPLAIADYLALGETALIPLTRDAEGAPCPITLQQSDAVTLVRSGDVIAARGAMVPVAAFPPGAETGYAPVLKFDAAGSAMTALLCREAADAIQIGGPLPGLARCGGYTFRVAEIEAALTAAHPEARLAALPHRLLGDRLAVSAQDAGDIEPTLRRITPLIATPRAA